MTASNLAVNGTTYRWPDNPIAIVCIDGGDPAYIEHGVSAGIIPNIALLDKFGIRADLGLDAVQLIGNPDGIKRFLEFAGRSATDS